MNIVVSVLPLFYVLHLCWNEDIHKLPGGKQAHRATHWSRVYGQRSFISYSVYSWKPTNCRWSPAHVVQPAALIVAHAAYHLLPFENRAKHIDTITYLLTYYDALYVIRNNNDNNDNNNSKRLVALCLLCLMSVVAKHLWISAVFYLTPVSYGTRVCPHFYRWLDTGTPCVEDQQTRNWPNCTDHQESAHQND